MSANPLKEPKAAFLFFIILFFLRTSGFAQGTEPTYAEKLGYPKDAKVIVLHVDDVGMSFESNEGAIDAMENGMASSLSVMMPCPWVPGFVHYLKQHPGMDAGLHLTLTSEWDNYRWPPLSGKPKVPGLVDQEGALWPETEDVVSHASADEVETEIRAQVERARNMGFEPSHLDSHMFTLFASPVFTERYIKVGIEYKIPVLFPGGHNTLFNKLIKRTQKEKQEAGFIGRKLWKAGLPVIDDLHMIDYSIPLPQGTPSTEENWGRFKVAQYITELKTLQPGITMILMHCTEPSGIFGHISASGPGRKADLLAMKSQELKQFMEKEGIIITNWRALKQRRDKVVADK
ncbi:polysaccharide deacetylase family protein [Flavitalea flava]